MHGLAALVLLASTVSAEGRFLVSAEWLAKNRDRTIVVHVGSPESFASAHIPGAHFLDVARLVETRNGRSDELPQIDRLQKTMEELGIGKRGRVVIYGEEPIFASRLFWTLEYLGQGGRIALLDGGLAKWKGELRPVAGGAPAHPSRPFTARIELERLTRFTQLRARGSVTVIDARPAAEFAAGHVPAAINVPWDSPPEELRRRLTAAPPARVVVYCHSGMSSSWTYFVLRSLGYDATLYDGGYEEWRDQPPSLLP